MKARGSAVRARGSAVRGRGAAVRGRRGAVRGRDEVPAWVRDRQPNEVFTFETKPPKTAKALEKAKWKEPTWIWFNTDQGMVGTKVPA